MIIFIINLILTWGIGLSIPLLIRYAIVQKPLVKPVAIIVSIINLFFMTAISISLGNNGKHTALGFVALVSYYILKKKDKPIK